MNSTIQTHKPVLALIVEDEPTIADYLLSLLGDMGITAEIAATIEHALSLVKAQTFDLAFVDLGMPDRSGLELIDNVQRDYPSLPIVISTGYGNRVLQDSIIAQRHVHLLQKPYTLADVSAVLVKCGFRVGHEHSHPT